MPKFIFNDFYKAKARLLPQKHQRFGIKNLILVCLLSLVFLGQFLPFSAFAQATSSFVSRGKAVWEVVEAFNLQKKHKAFLEDCLAHTEECFFVFSAQSGYDDISFNPLHLYPDVSLAYRYADAIHIATMLELVQGHIDSPNSPFYPRKPITRMQALKIIMGAGDFLHWKDRFELAKEAQPDLPFRDIDASSPDEWWYARYLVKALEENIIDAAPSFSPNEPITETDFQTMIERALNSCDCSNTGSWRM